jgi:hypothetical protein
MNIHWMLIELIEELDSAGIDVERYLKLLSAKTRRSEKRLIYWLTYSLEGHKYAELIEKYGFIDSLQEPDDFTSLKDAIV